VGVLPFFEVLDWDRTSVRVWPSDLDHIRERLRGIPQQMVTEMKEQVCVLYTCNLETAGRCYSCERLSLGLHPVVVFLLHRIGVLDVNNL